MCQPGYNIENEFGHCSYCICEDVNHSMIFNLHVFKEHRRQGHGSAMIKQYIEEIRATGYKGDIEVVADSDDGIDRDVLVKLYESFGLKIKE